MKKKVLAAMLCVSMTATMLAGCGGGGSDEKADMNGDGEELVEIIWQYPTTIDTTSEGFINMENALNELMEKDVGVHVTFEPVNLMESQNDAILKVSVGKKLDIMLTAFSSIGNVVSKGLVIPLDDLLDEYGQDILEHSHTKDMCGYQGETYGVCTGDVQGNSCGYLIKKEYWDKYNLAEETGWTEDKIYTTEELEHIFEIVKAGEGDNFYCDVPWNTTQEPMKNGYMAYAGGAAIQWSIPNTCENPEAAWIIEFGLEGEEYEVVEEDGDLKQIRWLADDIQSLPYYMPYGIWGNTLQWPAVEPAPIDDNYKKQFWDDDIPEGRISPAMGYSFVEEEVSTEISAVNTVIEQYTPSLNCGALDPEKALPEFLSALDAAGIDKVIEEQQKQFDTWLADQDQ